MEKIVVKCQLCHECQTFDKYDAKKFYSMCPHCYEKGELELELLRRARYGKKNVSLIIAKATISTIAYILASLLGVFLGKQIESAFTGQ